MLKIAKTYIWYRKRFARKDMNKVCITKLIQSISKDIIKSVNDYKKAAKDRKKLVLYSGQDNVMFSLLNELGETEFKCFEQAVRKKRAITKTKMKCTGFPNFAARITFELHHIGMSFMVVVLHGKKRILTKKIDEFPMWMKSLTSSRFDEFCYGKERDIHKNFHGHDGNDGDIDELEIKIYDKERILKKAVEERKKKEEKKQKKEEESKQKKESMKNLPIYKKIHNKLIDILGKRTVELGMFVIFCGFLFLSFKTIYGNYAAKRKLHWKSA